MKTEQLVEQRIEKHLELGEETPKNDVKVLNTEGSIVPIVNNNDNKDNVVGLNEYQQRINKNPVGGGWYHFYGFPKNEEGKLFISLIDKYLNRNVYGYRARGRGNGSYSHSLPSDQADSFVVYLDEKKKI